MLRRALTLLVLFMSLRAEAATSTAGGPFGLGIQLGDPSAITAKYLLDQNRAIDGGIAFDLGRWLLVYGDWLYHVPGAFGARDAFTARIAPYFGIGGLLAILTRSEWDSRHERYFDHDGSGKIALGVRVPLGLEWKPATVPVGIFLEIAPGLTIVPATHSFVQGGIGARFFF